MRHARHYAMPPADALALLERADALTVSASVDGRPVVRTLHGALVDDAVVFHGSRAGGKEALIGQPVVLSHHEIVARIPSWMRDPERACPATTYYRSVQAEGPCEEIVDHDAKAAALQALMERFQPEGGHRPITGADPLYANAVRGLRVLRVPLDRVTGRAKLGQRRSPEELLAIRRGLWLRGARGDVAAIAAIEAANPAALPLFPSPPGTRCIVAPGADRLPEALALLRDEYWNQRHDDEAIALAHRHSEAWVGLVDDRERLIASARGTSDRGKLAWIYDVAVAPAWRGRGVGATLMTLLLDHPAVRDLPVRLGTRDAERFYDRFGFGPLPPPPYRRLDLMRLPAPATNPASGPVAGVQPPC